jgi:ABC-type multidrug transport system fused ATPase/permease subunit
MKLLKKVWIIIPNEYKKKQLIMICFIIVGMLFEVFGIGVLLPILSAILNPDILLSNEFLNDFFQKINIQTNEEIIKFSLMSLLILYSLKSLYLIWLSYIQNKINFNLTASLSNILYAKFINRPYQYHISKNSSKLIKILQIEVKNFSIYLLALVSIISEMSLVIGVLISLLIIQPLGTLSLITFFLIFTLLFYLLTKNFTSKWGVNRELNDSYRSSLLLETFGGIKEIIISNSFYHFEKRNKKLNSEYSSISTKNITLNQVPRYYLELVTILAFVLSILYLISQGKNIDSLIVVLGVFTAAILRLLPSVNRILSSTQQLKFHRPSLDVLFNEFSEYNQFSLTLRNMKSSKITFQKNLRLESVEFSYADSEKQILNNIDLNVEKGSSIGIIGTSGSGKSTLINILAGLFLPDKGKFMIDGRQLTEEDMFFWRDNIGYVSQSTFLSDTTILENIGHGIDKGLISISRVNEVIKEAQLENLVNSLPNGLFTKVGERGVKLSGGEQQRIGIARALYKNPEILILDEATSSLDLLTESEFIRSINELKKTKTLIIVTHRLSTINDCDTIHIIKNGILTIQNSNNIIYE